MPSNNGGDIISLLASFGNVGSLPNSNKNVNQSNHINPGVPNLDFKKKGRPGIQSR